MKKIIAALLCVMMIASSVVSASALKSHGEDPNVIVGNNFVVGDANNDGVVNAQDTFNFKLFLVNDGDVDANGADINADGAINAKDLLILGKCFAEVDSLANYEDNNTVDTFTIAGNDISEYDIIYFPTRETDPNDANDIDYAENAHYAADTLRKFINIATGVNLGKTTTQTRAHKIEFVDVTGNTALEEKLEVENYIYEVVDGDLLIYGTRRGNMYAVYEILEEYLGFRFYNDTFTYEYADRYSDIPEGTYVFHDSYLEFRIAKQGFWRNDQLHYFPSRLNGSQHGDSSVAMGTLTGPHWINAHSFGKYWQIATGKVWVDGNSAANVHDYAAYKAKEDAGIVQNESTWNPCFTSDGDYDTLFRGLLEGIRYCSSWGHTFRKDTSLMSFSICDNRTVCVCPECNFIRNDGTQGRNPNKITNLNCGEAGLNLYLANRACDDIKAYYEGRAAGFDIDEDFDPTIDPETWEELDKRDQTSGFGQAIYDAYPDLRLYTILYDHSMPHEKLFSGEGYAEKYGYGYDAIIPRDNLCIMFCGNPCNNHYMGANECNGNWNVLGLNGEVDADAFAAWGDVTKQSGATMWFWYYPVNYNTYVTDSPNVFNIWYDFKYVVEECNVTGIYYEGASKGYIFENLKSHLATKFMWSMEENEDGSVSYMSYDEFLKEIEEYLMIHYGAGWEKVYEYLEMIHEASDTNYVGVQIEDKPVLDDNGEPTYAVSCYVNNCDYMGDMFSYAYLNEHYEYMRQLILDAWALSGATATSNDKNVKQMNQRYEFLFMNIEVMGLSAVRKAWYMSETATAEQKQTYMERYDYMFNFLCTETMTDGAGLNGREWNGNNGSVGGLEEYKRLIVNANYPGDWMETVAAHFAAHPDEDYYAYSIYGLTTGAIVDEIADNKDQNGDGVKSVYFSPGGESWRVHAGGWEWTGSVPHWNYA